MDAVMQLVTPVLCLQDMETNLCTQVDFTMAHRIKHSPKKGPIDLWLHYLATA